MILFVDKDTTLFRSSSIRYRGRLYKSTMETLEKAAEVTADIGESICNMVGGAFQLGNGHLDENEQAAANQLLKRRRKRNNKPRLS